MAVVEEGLQGSREAIRMDRTDARPRDGEKGELRELRELREWREREKRGSSIVLKRETFLLQNEIEK